MILDRLLIITSKKHSLLSPLKTRACASLFRDLVLHEYKSDCASLLIKMLHLFKPKPTLLGLLVAFVNNFQTLFDLDSIN